MIGWEERSRAALECQMHAMLLYAATEKENVMSLI